MEYVRMNKKQLFFGLWVLFFGVGQVVFADPTFPLPADVVQFQATDQMKWLIWMPFVMIYDLSIQNPSDPNKIDMVITDSQGRDATIPVTKSVIKRLKLESGDFLNMMHHKTGSVLIKDQDAVVNVIAPKGVMR
jgi:hypothetical protein